MGDSHLLVDLPGPGFELAGSGFEGRHRDGGGLRLAVLLAERRLGGGEVLHGVVAASGLRRGKQLLELAQGPVRRLGLRRGGVEALLRRRHLVLADLGPTGRGGLGVLGAATHRAGLAVFERRGQHGGLARQLGLEAFEPGLFRVELGTGGLVARRGGVVHLDREAVALCGGLAASLHVLEGGAEVVAPGRSGPGGVEPVADRLALGGDGALLGLERFELVVERLELVGQLEDLGLAGLELRLVGHELGDLAQLADDGLVVVGQRGTVGNG